VDTSVNANTMTLNVTPVNDAPSFTIVGADPSATDEDPANHGPAPQKSIPTFVSNLSKGPANESSQTFLKFNVSVDHPELFTANGKPAIDPVTGNLTFTPGQNQHGVAEVTISLQDSGGTANNGVDTSTAIQKFHITITKPLIWHNTKIIGGAANTLSGLDANDDNHVASNDIVAIVNYINGFSNFQNGKVPNIGQTIPNSGNPNLIAGYGTPYGYLDVNADGFVASNDALAIINAINGGTAGGEGEAQAAVPNDSYFADLGSFDQAPNSIPANSNPPPADALNDLIALLASDSASEQARRRRGG
jgi:hypothetical protein